MNLTPLFLLLSRPLIVHALNEDDSKLVREFREQYRHEFLKFLREIGAMTELKVIFDEFIACNSTPDEAASAFLSLMPSAEKRKRLAAMLVMVDMLGEARQCTSIRIKRCNI